MSRGSGRRDGDEWRRWQYGSGGGQSVAPYASDLIHAWYADREVVLATGVAGWGDAVGTADFTQADTTKQPAYGVFTTSPALVFDGVNDVMSTPSIDLSAYPAITIAFCATMVGGNRVIFETSAAAGVLNPGSILIYENGGNLNFEYYRVGTTRKLIAQIAATVRYVVVLDPGTNGADAWPRIYRNGVLVGAYGVTTGATGAIGSYAWTMGAFAAGGFPWSGKMGVDLMYGRALTAGEAAVVDAFLATRCV